MGWGLLIGKLKQTAQGAVLSLQRSVDNTAPFAPVCVGCSHVFRKRPQGVVQTLSAAKQGEAERLCDGCPCVGAEEICGAPSPTYPCRSVDNAVPSLHLAVPAQAGGIARSDIRVPELCEGGSPVGTRASAAFQANHQAKHEGAKRSIPPAPKKGQTFNLRSHTRFC